MTERIRIFIGYDSKEPAAYHVLAHSILARASGPISIAPVARRHLRGIYDRPRGRTESTEFSMTRFLVPYLCGFRGRAVFLDCDMLCRADIFELAEICDPSKAVSVCQHDYTPRHDTKFLGQPQSRYPRKNWSSLMVMNTDRCHKLTPEYVAEASGLDLHRFAWLEDSQIGSIPLEWNWLVGEYAPNPQAKLLHYTLGGPWFPDTRDCEHAAEWLAEHQAATSL